ncbi:3D domain-containing protein [Paenibacillus sp. YPG26]|uniref:3D domain-containing protein n=1 Tax=Paenibacillus sp. YPG26 TaxID=2878915 RepID=UPI0020426991|nr:3D domain-containing protein [Paenibacillus sp. YPG26]USB33294.1 G5 domain-containing protein [Paenibacillus sp. YPG26]
MGFFGPKETTHGSRSSSMSYALRWKQENKRQIIVGGIITVALLVSVMAWFYIQADKSIYLVADGTTQSAGTPETKPDQVLEQQEANLNVGENGSPSLSSTFQDGNQLFIDRVVPVKVTADGVTNQHLTTADNVQEAISKLGVSVSSEDKVYPSLNSPIQSDLHIRIVRVDKHILKRTESIPYTFVKTSDPSLEKGKTKLVQKGRTGVVVHEIEKVYQDGEFVSKRLVNKSVEKQPSTKVLAVGTKPKTQVLAASIDRSSQAVKISQNNSIKKGGVQFKYKKVLKNVSLTAYSSEEDGIGTRTASGTRVSEGRTIAVDTKVIPMGWWVYIEGVGFRRAEDTGGAIKGNKIDVYYDSLKAANNFGRKKGRTVYVIGPVKPELN